MKFGGSSPTRSEKQAFIGAVLLGGAMLFAIGACGEPVEQDDEPASVDASDLENGSASRSDEDGRPGPISLEEELDQIVRGYDLTDLPDVPTVRTVTPEERELLFAECMGEAGFPQQQDSGYRFDDPSQAEPFGLALYECTVMYPLDDHYRQPLTDAQLALVHEHTLETMIPCYEENGWPIDRQGMPSLETFIATWGTSEQWTPGLPPEDMPPDVVSQIEGTCAWAPPSEELYASDLLEGS